MNGLLVAGLIVTCLVFAFVLSDILLRRCILELSRALMLSDLARAQIDRVKQRASTGSLPQDLVEALQALEARLKALPYITRGLWQLAWNTVHRLKRKAMAHYVPTDLRESIERLEDALTKLPKPSLFNAFRIASKLRTIMHELITITGEIGRLVTDQVTKSRTSPTPPPLPAPGQAGPTP